MFVALKHHKEQIFGVPIREKYKLLMFVALLYHKDQIFTEPI